MNNWIKADWDFGVPAARLIVHLRSEIGRQLLTDLRDEDDRPDLMELVIRQVVERVRPELEGLTVVGINLSHRFGTIAIDVIHPSLPKKPCFECWQEQMLELCSVCKGPILVGDKQWMSYAPGVGIVCSKECAEAERTHEDNVKEAMARLEKPLADRPAVPNRYVCEKCGHRMVLEPSQYRRCVICKSEYVRKQRVGE